MRPTPTPAFTPIEEEISPERTLVLEPIDGKKPLSSTGNVDPRLFTGGNNCRVLMDRQSGLWYFKFDVGALPEPLRAIQFTSFAKAKEHASAYFSTRNIQIADVKR